MRDVDTLISTISAYMRYKLVANEHKPHWTEEDHNSLFLGLQDEISELIQEIGNPDFSAERVWSEVADVCNFACFLADLAVKTKTKVIT